MSVTFSMFHFLFRIAAQPPAQPLLLAALWILTGCSATRPPTRAAQATCSLQLQGGFLHERVTVFADDQRIFSGSVTSNPVIGLAKAVSIPTPDAQLRLRVEMPASRVVRVWSLDLRRGRVLGITRYPSGRLDLLQQAGPFYYD